MSQKSSAPKFDLSIVIPAYKEEKRIGKTLNALQLFLQTDETIRPLKVEVIVVSADSPDKTHEIIEDMADKFACFRLLKPGPKVGKGRDVQFGMLHAAGDTVVFMDADLATPLKYIAKFYRARAAGADVVIATRNLLKHHPNYLRRLISNGGNLLFRFAGGVWIEDSQCGFKMFSSAAARTCFSRLKILGWGFDMEILAIAKANKLKIASYRVDDWRSIPDGTFVDGVMKNSITSLKDLGRILIRRLVGTYKRESAAEATDPVQA